MSSCLCLIVCLDVRQRTGYYDTQPFTVASRARSARLLVYVKVLDEITFTEGKMLSLIWALDSGSALMLSQYNFKVTMFKFRFSIFKKTGCHNIPVPNSQPNSVLSQSLIQVTFYTEFV